MAYHATAAVPGEIRDALQDAMETAIENVPAIEGQVYVAVDVSGSMSAQVTRKTKVRCIDVAALVGAAILRKNPTATVLPFAEDVKHVHLNPRDSVMTNAAKRSFEGRMPAWDYIIG